MAIEQTYGMLKRRFPALKHGLRFRDISKSANCVIAAVVLHNVCVKSMDFFDQNNQQIEENIENLEHEEFDFPEKNFKRDNIAAFLMN